MRSAKPNPMGPPESKKPRRSIMVKFAVNNDILDTSDKSVNDGDPNAELNGGDTVFDPCAEMMIHDFDDERTLDEEEALENNEDTQTELSDLQKEGDMPLSELLAMYGYGEPNGSGSEDEEGGEEEEAEQESTIVANNERKDVIVADDVSEEVEEPSQLAQLYPEIPTPNDSGGTSRYLRSGSRPQSEEEEDDCDYSPDEEEWKKTIMVGSDYQAKIPVGLFKYDDALPYENDDKMLWDPSSLGENETVTFLTKIQDGTANLQTKDDEHALYLLLQCGYNVEEALRRRRINCVPPTDTMSIWSEEECRNFETGMRLYGKDFHTIQKTKVRTRSVGELVQFYYLWKKTERHDVYAHKSRLEKKKYSLHPGITDYMDRFLEEQDVGSAPPNVHLLMYSDSKKNRDSPATAESGGHKPNQTEVSLSPATENTKPATANQGSNLITDGT